MKNNKIIKICNEKLIYLNYSENTIKTYIYHISKFVSYIGDKQITHCNSTDFQTYLSSYKFKSVSQQNQVINSIRFLYKFGLNKKYDKVDFNRPRQERKLPRPIDTNKLKHSISKITNVKHKAIISIAFSVGLRVSEVINLKITDIDSKRMIININQSKGNKDRVVPLTEGMLVLLREYFKLYNPEVYLFNGQNGLKYSSSSCNNIVKKYIGKQYHFHQLRHSCFTSLTEQNVDIRAIQKLAGHSSSRTTEVYTCVSTNTLSKLPLVL